MSEIKKDKRVRTTNFTDEEEEVLLRLVRRHSDAIDSKKTDAATLADKQHAWESVTASYNQQCPTRLAKALKDKYTNVKTIIRRCIAAEAAGNLTKKWRPKTRTIAELARYLHGSTTSPAKFAEDGESRDDDDDDDDEDDRPLRLTHELPLPEFLAIKNEMEIIDVRSQHDANVEPIANGSPHRASLVDCSEAEQNGTVPKYSRSTEQMLRKPEAEWQKHPRGRPASAADFGKSLMSLKRRKIEQEMRMREEAHAKQMAHQQLEHEARMAQIRDQTALSRMNVKIAALKYRKLLTDCGDASESE